jgi:hypothetical protein
MSTAYGLTQTEIMSMTRGNVRDKSFRRFPDGMVCRACNTALTKLQNQTGIQISYYEIATTAGENLYGIPATANDVFEVLYDPDGQEIRLTPSSRSEIHGMGSYSTNEGTPECYYVSKPGEIEIWPAPGTTGVKIRVYFTATNVYGLDTALSGPTYQSQGFSLYYRTSYAHTLCPPQYHHVIPMGAAAVLYEADGDLKAAQYWHEQFGRAIQEINARPTHSDKANRTTVGTRPLGGYG